MATSQDSLPHSRSQTAALVPVDLIRRYCPGLEAHTPEQIARHIPADPTECWPWPFRLQADGHCYLSLEATPYGYVEPVHVHRYMYDVLVGEIPVGIHVHHRCHHRACWNPFHLQAVTPKQHLALHGMIFLFPQPVWQGLQAMAQREGVSEHRLVLEILVERLRGHPEAPACMRDFVLPAR